MRMTAKMRSRASEREIGKNIEKEAIYEMYLKEYLYIGEKFFNKNDLLFETWI